MAIPNIAFKVMEDVEGLLGTSSRLLDAGEVEHVLEHVFSILDTFPLSTKVHPFLG